MENEVEYIVVSDYIYANFNKCVNIKLQQGWRLHGGVSTAIESSTLWYSQALIKSTKVVLNE